MDEFSIRQWCRLRRSSRCDLLLARSPDQNGPAGCRRHRSDDTGIRVAGYLVRHQGQIVSREMLARDVGKDRRGAHRSTTSSTCTSRDCERRSIKATARVRFTRCVRRLPRQGRRRVIRLSLRAKLAIWFAASIVYRSLGPRLPAGHAAAAVLLLLALRYASEHRAAVRRAGGAPQPARVRGHLVPGEDARPACPSRRARDAGGTARLAVRAAAASTFRFGSA